jgi:hypothetical protein
VFSEHTLDGSISSTQAFVDADASGAAVPVDRSGNGPRRRAGINGIDVVTFRDTSR